LGLVGEIDAHFRFSKVEIDEEKWELLFMYRLEVSHLHAFTEEDPLKNRKQVGFDRSVKLRRVLLQVRDVAPDLIKLERRSHIPLRIADLRPRQTDDEGPAAFVQVRGIALIVVKNLMAQRPAHLKPPMRAMCRHCEKHTGKPFNS
jgi:DNA-directed RNA polymerase subunit F